MGCGKSVRLSRLVSNGLYTLLALDHPLSLGVLRGLEGLDRWIDFANRNPISGIVIHRGELARSSVIPKKGVILQLMGLPSVSVLPKVHVATVEDALRLGVDGVSLQLALYADDLRGSLRQVAVYASEATRYDLPVLLMLADLPKDAAFDLPDAIRMCSQLEIDLLKIGLPPEPWDSGFKSRLVAAVGSAPPLVLAGGERSEDFMRKLEFARDLGFCGVCVGRNIFQADQPEAEVNSIQAVLADMNR